MCDGQVFEEDADLSDFLSGNLAAVIYIKKWLIPFTKKHTPAQCKHILLNPPENIVDATRRMVAQMANGGLEPAPHNINFNTQSDAAATNLVIEVHRLVDCPKGILSKMSTM